MQKTNELKQITLLLTFILLFTGCEKGKDPYPGSEENVPRILLDDSFVSAPGLGCECTVSYRIVNPVKGANVSVVPRGNWIDGIDVSVPGKIKFRVLRNAVEEERETIMKVYYMYVDSIPEIKVRQGVGIPYPFDIRVSGETDVSADIAISPVDKKQTYLVFGADSVKFAGFKNEEEIFEHDMKLLKDYAESINRTFPFMLDIYSHKGDYSFQFTDLKPDTPHVVYVYGIDLGKVERTTEIVINDFRTEKGT